MSEKFKIYDQNSPHFITSTIVNWVDLFTRNEYRNVIIDSLRYCQENKGLLLYGYCIMTNHIHLIIGSEGNKIQNIVRDFKSFTSSNLHKLIKNHPQESRKQWILAMTNRAGTARKSNRGFQLWQHHYHPIELDSPYLIEQKMEYIHMNPVKAGFVVNPEDYLYSSARNFAGRTSVIELDINEY